MIDRDVDLSGAVDGARAVSPFLLGVVPFGVIYGVTAVDRGLPPVVVAAMSIVVFAGAAQLAAVELLARDAPLAVVVATIVVVNLRYPMYAASIAPHFKAFATRSRAICAYLLTDQAYAISLTEYREHDPDASRRLWYYLGAAVTLWIAWQVSTIVGVLLGARVPAGLSLEFAIPLTFLALLVPNVDDAYSALAALVGGVGAVAGAALPYDVGLVAAALAGVSIAALLEAAREPTGEDDEGGQPAGEDDEGGQPTGEDDEGGQPAGKDDEGGQPAGKDDEGGQPAGEDDEGGQPAGKDDEGGKPAAEDARGDES